MKKQKTSGIEVTLPKEKCDDKNCPFHGTLKLHGRVFVGKVKSTKMHKTATIEWERLFYLKKYERYEKRKTKIKAHVPPCISVKEGDVVKIMESRPISKTKNFVIIENETKQI